MPIEKSRELWKGTEASDLDEFVKAFAAGGYPIATTAHSRCANCGGTIFALRVDDDEGFADRRCVSCGEVFHMLDSAEYVEDASPEECACPCGGEEFEVAVGYALRQDGDVRWVSIATRCIRDGTLGVYADWKIDYGPAGHLLEGA